jgi:signal transduction histidine kinase
VAGGVLLVGGAPALKNESCRTAINLLGENLGSALIRIEREANSPQAAPPASPAGSLAEHNRQMEVFLATATHELRAPLSGIVSYAEVLSDYFDTLSDAERRSLCSALNQQCKALMGLVDELFDLARIRSGRLTLDAQPTNTRELVGSAIDLLSPVAAERNLHLECHLEDAKQVVLDPIKIRQCVLNLLTNAIKFTADGGTIRVELSSEATGIRVAVTDTGRGVAPEEIEKIFDLFHTGAGRADSKSLGLGLYLVKSFVELHGGRVWVRSSPGEGSTFGFALPWSPPRANVELESHAA